jgi:hypothetical protein
MPIILFSVSTSVFVLNFPCRSVVKFPGAAQEMRWVMRTGLGIALYDRHNSFHPSRVLCKCTCAIWSNTGVLQVYFWFLIVSGIP